MSVTGGSAPWTLDSAGAPVPVTGTSVPPTADPTGDAVLVSGVLDSGLLDSDVLVAEASPLEVDATRAGASAAVEPPGPTGVVAEATAP